MRTAASIWTWLAIGVLSIVAMVGQLVLVLAWPVDRNRYLAGRWLRLMAVTVVKVTPTWRFAVHGALPAKRPRKVVVVSNHASHTDAFLISHLPWEMKWLGKRSLFRIPVLGWAMWLGGDVGVQRGDKGSAGEAMARCARYLERGMPIMIFPEGTRSQTEALLPFKDGAFRLAIETGAEVLPIAVAGTSTALTKHDWRLGTSRAFVTVGEPIPTTGMTLDDVPELRERARRAIDALRARIMPLATR